MGKKYFILFCNESVASRAIEIVLTSDDAIKLTGERVTDARNPRDVVKTHLLQRDSGEIRLSQTGPYKGEYWISVSLMLDSANATAAFDLAEHIQRVLEEHGARVNDLSGNAGGFERFRQSRYSSR